MFRVSAFQFAATHAKQQQQQKLSWYQQKKMEAGYFWGEKKKELFFIFVACFALGQVAYREASYRGWVTKEHAQSRSQPPPVNNLRGGQTRKE